MDRSNYMCFWILLHFLECLVFSMSSVHLGWSKFGQLNHKICNLNSSDIDKYKGNSAAVRKFH